MKKLFLVFILMLVWLQYRIWSPDGGVSEWLRLQNELSLAQAKITMLEARNEALTNIVIDLQSHTAAIETQAREVLHFIAPHETFFRVITIPKEISPAYLPELPKTRLSAKEHEPSSVADVAAEAPP
jgi:cell division protein FtsB